MRGRGAVDRLDEALLHAELGQPRRDVKPERRAQQLAVLGEHAVAVQVTVGGEVGHDLERVLRVLQGAGRALPAVGAVREERLQHLSRIRVQVFQARIGMRKQRRGDDLPLGIRVVLE